MASSCPRCGDRRADPLRGSMWYNVFKAFGYRLAECGRCRRKRLFARDKQGERRRERQSQSSSEVQGVTGTAGNIETGKPFAADGESAQQTQPPMGAEAASMPSSIKDVVEGAAKAEDQKHSLYSCPTCGSRDCRRSRRTFWEHLLGRGKMLRCRNCRRRFPQRGRPTRPTREVPEV
jgi:hypothetical protein